MIKLKEKNNKGFTLIEGLVALAVLAIFIPLFYSLNSYINKSFSVANRQSDLQFYTRLAKTKIEKELDLAKSLQILSANPDSNSFELLTERAAICINDDKNIVIRTINADNAIVNTPLMDLASGVEMDLSFKKVSSMVGDDNVCGDKLLGFTITCSNGKDVVSLESSYLLKNKFIIVGESSGIAIIYNH